jgi:hypothetical protein
MPIRAPLVAMSIRSSSGTPFSDVDRPKRPCFNPSSFAPVRSLAFASPVIRSSIAIAAPPSTSFARGTAALAI